MKIQMILLCLALSIFGSTASAGTVSVALPTTYTVLANSSVDIIGAFTNAGTQSETFCVYSCTASPSFSVGSLTVQYDPDNKLQNFQFHGFNQFEFTLDPGVTQNFDFGSFTAGMSGTVAADLMMSVLDSAGTYHYPKFHFSATIGEAFSAGSLVFQSVDSREIPEPASIALLSLGLAGIGLARSKRLG